MMKAIVKRQFGHVIRRHIIIVALLATGSLSGCSITSLWQPKDAAVRHLPWNELRSALPGGTQQQQFEFTHDSNTYTFQAVTQNDAQQLTMIVLSELGNRICTVNLTNDRFVVTPRRNIFLNLPFASVFAATLLTQLDGQDLTRVVTDDNWQFPIEKSRRELRYAGKPVATIDFGTDTNDKPSVRYRQHQLDYVLVIQSQVL